uniref:Uncharacterized protein n=1 Tax=Maylandia zebra TaxID=106582 RepID=A0A3P9BYM5_9CICH
MGNFISKQLHISRLSVQTILCKYKLFECVTTSTSSRCSKIKVQACYGLETAETPASLSPVKRVFHHRKKPLVQNQHFQAQLKFAAFDKAWLAVCFCPKLTV